MSFTDYNNILRVIPVILTRYSGIPKKVMKNYLDYDLQQCTVFQVTEFDVVHFQFSKICFGEEFSRAKIEIILVENKIYQIFKVPICDFLSEKVTE